MTRLRRIYHYLFGTDLGRICTNAFCAVMWVLLAASYSNPVMIGFAAFISAMFAVNVGLNIGSHYNEQVKAIMQRHIDHQRDVIDGLLEEMEEMVEKERDAS